MGPLGSESGVELETMRDMILIVSSLSISSGAMCQGLGVALCNPKDPSRSIVHASAVQISTKYLLHILLLGPFG